MVDDQDKKEDSFEIDSAGEATEYISLDQARVLAIRHASENTDFYPRRYRDRDLVWEVASAEADEDYYHIRLTFRPARRFRGEPGVELITIDKVGEIELRQLLNEPAPTRRWRIPAMGASVIAVAVVLIGIGLFNASRSEPAPTAVPTLTPVAAIASPLAKATPMPALQVPAAVPFVPEAPQDAYEAISFPLRAYEFIDFQAQYESFN